MYFVSCVTRSFASFYCCLVVTCWENALVGDVNCIFVTFPCDILGQVCYLIVSFPDLCRLLLQQLLKKVSFQGYTHNKKIVSETLRPR